MKNIPTLSDLLHNRWEKRKNGELVWHWGDHKVMFIAPNGNLTTLCWFCPRCGRDIVLRHFPTKFSHCHGDPVDLTYPVSLYCAYCQKSQFPDYQGAEDYDSLAERIEEDLSLLNNTDPNDQASIKKILDEITIYQKYLKEIEKNNGWTYGGNV